jgi:UDP-3-O-[3-hydroxymyristoyl] glucosamine N-acyltransferase LpxD
MKSTLKFKPSEVFSIIEDFLACLEKEGFSPTLPKNSTLAKSWANLNSPCSSTLPEVSNNCFCYNSTKNELSPHWGLIFCDSNLRKELLPNELGVKFPEAAMDLLLRKVAHEEWVGKENSLDNHSHILAEGSVWVGPDCEIGEGVILESGVRIGARVKIGKGTRIGANSRIADDTVVGERCHFRGAVNLGSFGFGFTRYPKSPLPVHRCHVGSLYIGDDVKLGAFVSIDRGILEDSVVGLGTAMDNHVHIGHNCKIGRYNILCAFVGLAGSTIFGDFVTLGGLVMSKGHLKVGDGAQIGAFSGITGDVAAGAQLRGMPARPIRRDLRILAIQDKLPELYSQMKTLLRAGDLK